MSVPSATEMLGNSPTLPPVQGEKSAIPPLVTQLAASHFDDLDQQWEEMEREMQGMGFFNVSDCEEESSEDEEQGKILQEIKELASSNQLYADKIEALKKETEEMKAVNDKILLHITNIQNAGASRATEQDGHPSKRQRTKR